MQFYQVTKQNSEELLDLSVRAIKFGRLVVAKADTSYAILGLPYSRRAMDELKRIKNGRGSKLYSIFVDNKKDILSSIPEEHKDVVKTLIPGEVTIVTNKRKPGMRYVRQKTILELIKRVGEPLTATSANPSAEAPAKNEEDMRKYFSNNRIIVLYEGGVREKLPSTIIDFSSAKPKVLRQGAVTLN